jgi:predicted SAM-dependent methyltransferase
MSEHVLEHLTLPEAIQTARNIFEFLRSGGHWRIAVPDVNNPSSAYHDWNSPKGWGQWLHRWFIYEWNEPTHQNFYALSTLAALLSHVGFIVYPREWYDERGCFHRVKWSDADGLIKRSYGHPYLHKVKMLHGVYNTSLIVDAVKP